MLVVSTERHGGTSVGLHSSYNLSYGVGDSKDSVTRNREQLKQDYGIPILLSAGQVHSDEVFLLDKTLQEDMEVEGYDALITNQPGVGLLIQQADCQAITLYDPLHQAIAAIHSGWKGSVCNIAAKTVELITSHFHSNPAQLEAYISPSLGPCCAEFVNHSIELPPSFLKYQETENHFNFWKISIMQLIGAGVQEKNIRLSGQCTVCSNDFFSYRRACKTGNGVTGRGGTVIML